MNEKSIQLSSGSGRDGRITHQDVQKASLTPTAPVKVKGKVTENGEIGRKSTRRPMSMLRRRVAETLVAAKNNTAMLTTFNEVDMSAIIKIRAENQEKFMTKHGIKLGYMSFFAQAICQAIKEFPLVNGQIDQSDIITFDHIDLGVAVSTDRGLIVPVVKNAEKMSHAQLEHSIANLAEKARIGKITLEDLEGGTFTLTNGGIFGSMLSTPILNPPQSGILGMHNIVKRAVVIEDEITIRPMMYIALSYDHRIIDGRESVGFLIKVKELLESPVIPEM
jgi:2-oxoglutarate dehydrogenase E2 component (dihydrolipoamide succinyltransferase)